jgi:hypothetical protein
VCLRINQGLEIYGMPLVMQLVMVVGIPAELEKAFTSITVPAHG